MIESAEAIVILCHLRRGTIPVRTGQRVRVGEPVAGCGNSGNSTEPHVHVQAIDDLDIERAHPVRLSFGGMLPRNGQIIDVPG